MRGETMNVYQEPSRSIPVLGEWDLIVCGGGAAGCAAAVTAGRMGVKTLLVERYGFLGGATVSQLVGHILSTNGVDFQGIWHDWIRAIRTRRDGAACALHVTPSQLRCGVDPEVVKFAWDDLLAAADVQQLLHATVSSAILDQGILRGAVLDTRAGRQAVFAKCMIDATGDAVLCDAAGALWDQGHPGGTWNQSLTTVFRMGNVHWPEGGFAPEEVARAKAVAASENAEGRFACPVVANGRAVQYPTANWVHESVARYRTEMNVFSSRVLKGDSLDPFNMTRAEREGRQQAWQCAEFIRHHLRGYERSYLLDTGMHIGLRDSRRVRGDITVTHDDAWNFRKRADGIARSSWDIDIWPGDSYDAPAVPRGDAVYQERMQRVHERGEYFDIPYGCLLPAGVENLLVAGRCISAERETQASLRIQQTCQATGEAAGVAAAMAIGAHLPPRRVATDELVLTLNRIRARIDPAFSQLSALPVAPRT